MAVTFEQNEDVVLESRRHWFIFAKEIIILTVIFLLPVFIYGLLTVLPITIIINGSVTALLLFFYGIWILGIWTAVIIFWTDYFLDVFIITNKRIIDVDQKFKMLNLM